MQRTINHTHANARLFITIVTCGLLATMPVAADDALTVSYEVIALTGTDGELGLQLGTGIVFDEFPHPPSINNNSDVAFRARLSGAGVDGDNDTVLIISDSDGLHVAAQTGSGYTSVASGSGSWNMGNAFPIADNSDVALGVDSPPSCSWPNSGTNASRVVRFTVGENTLVARARDKLPSVVPGAGYGTPSSTLINSGGDIIWRQALSRDYRQAFCKLSDPLDWPIGGFPNVIQFSQGGAAPTPIVATRHFLPAVPSELGPGLGLDIYFDQLRDASLSAVNDNGVVAFGARLDGVSCAQRGTIYRASTDGLELVAQTGVEGQYGPGLGDGTTFTPGGGCWLDWVGAPTGVRVNNASRVAFGASVTGEVSGTGVFFADPDDAVQTVALEGVTDELGPQFGSYWFTKLVQPNTQLAVDASGRIYFGSIIYDGNWMNGTKRTIHVHENGVNQPIAITGVTGVYGPGPGFGVFTSQDFRPFTVNDHGQLVFQKRYGGGVGTPGIWIADLENGIHLIANPGMAIEVAPDDIREIDWFTSDALALTAGAQQDGRPRALNNHGEIAMRLDFTDGTQAIVIATVESKPECAAPEDLNCDGVVNVFDLLLLLDNWGECVDPDDCPADLDGDGTVNVFDLLLLLENWG